MEPNPSFTHTVPGLWLETERRAEEEKREDKKLERKEDDGALVCKVQAGRKKKQTNKLYPPCAFLQLFHARFITSKHMQGEE